ncbi:MAG: alpha-amylase family glycosyl hydrolase, partial [Actinomycetes bacterium]
TGQWYLHLFLPAQPDLNWENPEVRAAMAETLRFWMARGVSGFRVDVAHGLGKDPALPDSAPQPVSGFNDQVGTHDILADLRQLVDDWPDDPPRMMVGEVYLPTTPQVATYYGSSERPELHLSFNFPPLFAPWDAAVWTERIREVEDLIVARGHWPTWVLSNHDQPRHRTRYGSEARARAAAILLLTLRGTPFVYAGEELGLEDAVVPPGRRVDPGGRDGCRAPLPWDDSPGHGWSAAREPWLPWPPDVDAGRTVTALQADPASILHLYRRLLALRAASPALRSGSLALIDAGPDVVAYRRSAPGDDRLVAVNFSDAPVTAHLPDGPWQLDLASADGAAAIDGSRLTLGPDQAVVASSGAAAAIA